MRSRRPVFPSWDATAGALDMPRWAAAAMSSLDAIRRIGAGAERRIDAGWRCSPGQAGPALNSLTACAASSSRSARPRRFFAAATPTS